MADVSELIIGIDAGTSVIKAVAFDLSGRQRAISSVPNTYAMGANGSATQSLSQTWADCVAALKGLADKVDGLAARTAAVSLTAQGDGTWLVGAGNRPVTDAWIWLDARAAPTVDRLVSQDHERARFEVTGTGLNTCQQGAQLAHIDRHHPELLDASEAALHCKDWLYLNLTGVRATDPSEASWTFGDFRTRRYDDTVIGALGLEHRRHLLPEIVDGTEIAHPLTDAAADATGLRAGTPVALAYVDMVMTGMGAGLYTGEADAACSITGSTGVHMRVTDAGAVHLNDAGTGYVMALPMPGLVAQMQTNMASTLNIDWLLSVAADLLSDLGHSTSHHDLISQIERWVAGAAPARMIYHPYVSEAGERGPFMNAAARAAFNGLNSTHRFPDLLRGVIEGLGLAARDCYETMGDLPTEVRLTGGAARSNELRRIVSSSIGAPVRYCEREEAGAAGAAMVAAVAIGAYADMDSCVADWVTPLLGPPEPPDVALMQLYSQTFPAYRAARLAMEPLWDRLRSVQEAHDA